MADAKIKIEVDDSGVMNAAERDAKAFDKVDKSAEKAGKSAEKAGEQMSDGMGKAADAASSMSENAEKAAESTNELGREAKKNEGSVNELADAVGKLTENQDRQLSVLNQLNEKLGEQAANVEKIAGKQRESNEEQEKQSNILVKLMGGQANYNAIVAALPPQLQSAISAMEGLTKASAAFIATPIGMVVAALATAVALLTAYFKGATDGEDEFVKVSGYAKGVLSALNDAAIDTGRDLWKMFTGATEKGKVFAGAVDIITNSFDGLLTSVQQVKMAFKAFLDGDFSAETWKKISSKGFKANLQMVTGQNFLKGESTVLGQINEKAKTREKLEEDLQKVQLKRTSLMEREAEIDYELSKLRREASSTSDPAKKLEARAKAQELVNEKYKEQIRLAKEEVRIQEGLNANSSSKHADEEALEQKKAQVKRIESQMESEMLAFDRRAMSAESSMARQAAKDAKEEATAQNNMTMLRERAAANEAREAKRRELQIAQAKAEAMEEGHEKVLALLKVQSEQELLTIEQQKDDALMKKISEAQQMFSANKGNQGKIFDISSVKLSDEELSQFERLEEAVRAKIEKAQNDVQKQEEAAMRDYLREYGSYQQKRLAIAQEYAEKISKAQTEGERLKLKREEEKAIDALNMKQLELNLNWETVFNDLDKVSKQHLQTLKNELEIALKEGIKNGSMTAENAKVIAERIAKINQESASRSFSLRGSTAQGYDAARERMLARIDELRAKSAKANGEELKDLSSQILQTVANLKDLDEEEKSLRVRARVLGEAFGLVSEHMKGLNNLLDAIGLGNTGVGKAAKNIGSGIDNAGKAMEAAAKGNWFQGAANAVLAIQDFGRAFGVGGGNAAEVARVTEENTREIASLTQSVNALKEVMASSNGSTAELIKAYNTALQAQRSIVEDSRKTLESQMNYYNAHHSNSYYINEEFSQSDWQKINAALKQAGSNKTVSNAKGLWGLTPEEMKSVMMYANDIYQKIKETGEYDKSEYLDDYIAYAGSIEDLTNQLKESITGISFDSLLGNFTSSLMDMDREAKDFSSDFTRYLMQSVLSAKLGEELSGELDKWQEEWAKRMQQRQGELTEGDVNELKMMWDGITQKGIEIRDSLAKITGYDKASSDQISATQKSAASMSEQTASELNGRFTSMQLSMQKMSDEVTLGMQELRSIAVGMSDANQTLSDINAAILANGGYLTQIWNENARGFANVAAKVEQLTNIINNKL